jgi:hypothetical protein
MTEFGTHLYFLNRGQWFQVSDFMILKGNSMKTSNLILSAFAAVALGSAAFRAHGTLYVSNLDETPTGRALTGSDAWLAQIFHIGTNADGYVVNAVQLRTDVPSGSPSGFEAFIYSSSNRIPEHSLGPLTGPDPAEGGVFTFAGSDIFLSPSSYYFVVITAATPASDGAYAWSMTDASATVVGWDIPNIGRYRSDDGTDWTFVDRQEVFQMAIDATAVPEPSTLCLAGLGLGVLWLRRRSARQAA